MSVWSTIGVSNAENIVAKTCWEKGGERESGNGERGTGGQGDRGRGREGEREWFERGPTSLCIAKFSLTNEPTETPAEFTANAISIKG